MTICITGISKENEIIVATDKMLTYSLLGSFEFEFDKFVKVNNNSLFLVAGETVTQRELQKRLFHLLKEKDLLEGDVEIIKDAIEEVLYNYRFELLHKSLIRYDIHIEELKKILLVPVQNDVIKHIQDSFMRATFNNEFIVTGFNEEGNAQIFVLEQNPENPQPMFHFLDLTDIGMAAIGSGKIQAVNSLMFDKFSKKKSTKEAIYYLYTAKKKAEVAMGVGKETKMFVFNNKEGIKEVNVKIIEKWIKKEKTLKNKNIKKYIDEEQKIYI